MCYKSLSFLTLCVATVMFMGCGEMKKYPSGEEVVDKWIEPEDIGKNYTVEAPNVGDTVLLSTEIQHTIEENDFVSKKVDDLFVSTLVNVRENPEDPGTCFYDREIY